MQENPRNPAHVADDRVTGDGLTTQLKNPKFILIRPASGHELPIRDFGPDNRSRSVSQAAGIPAGRRVAVIGSGVAGLTAAYVLNGQDRVTLYEADSRLGGHAHTHDVPQQNGPTLGVDTGFIVHNERTYPTLLRLFAELGVQTQDSEMSMSVLCDGCGLEYAGARPKGRGIIPRPSTLLRGRAHAGESEEPSSRGR